MLLLFDYDGVIVDSFDLLLEICIDAQATLGAGRAPTPEDFRTIHNLTFDELGRTIDIPASKCAAYAQRVLEIQQQGWRPQPFPGIVDILSRLTNQHTLAIVTNSQSEMVAAALNEFGLGAGIARVTGGESGASKVDRILHLQRVYASAADSTYMIGDTLGDIRAGKAARVRTVAVTWGFQPRSLLQQESPDHLLDSPAELLFIGRDGCEHTL